MPMPSPMLLAAILPCVLVCGCGPAGNPADELDAVPAPTPASAPASPPASASASALIAYRCADGRTLEAGYGEHDVTLRWADGRSVRLPRAESASGGDGDVYVGEQVSLQRDGDTLQLHDAGRAATSCDAIDAAAGAVATAALVRYDCEAGTTVTVDPSGSARVALPDGQVVGLSRIAGSTPPVYTGGSLYLRIEGGGARLSQADRNDELACTVR